MIAIEETHPILVVLWPTMLVLLILSPVLLVRASGSRHRGALLVGSFVCLAAAIYLFFLCGAWQHWHGPSGDGSGR